MRILAVGRAAGWQFLETSLQVVIVLFARLSVRTTDQIQIGLTPAGRLARRLAIDPELRLAARRLAAMHYRFKYGVTEWQAAAIVHDSVSVLEEVACQRCRGRAKKLDGAIEVLERSRTIDSTLAREMKRLYIDRNQLRGAGHGVAGLDREAAQGVVDAVTAATSALLDRTDSERVVTLRERVRAWWTILNWKDVT